MSELFDPKSFLKTVTSQPGVYRMYDAENRVIYVGKAKNLKKRLSSYFYGQLTSKKTEIIVSLIRYIDVTVTHTETEALLLEHDYIKIYRPRYNIMLRDDKSYPFIFLCKDIHPRLTIYRGSKNEQGEYFGPFPNIYAVRKTLALLQKIFPIRQCENSIYRNRSRPCLQYQIGRCLGPCVKGLVSEEKYAQQVEYVRLFLTGKDDQLLTQLISRMEKASVVLSFEQAAKIRDQIQMIRQITKKQQYIFNINDNLDVIGIYSKAELVCINLLSIRYGRIIENSNFFQKVPYGTEPEKVIEDFITHFYLNKNQIQTYPNEVLVDFNFKNKTLLADFFSKIYGKQIILQTKPRGNRIRYIKLVRTNIATALAIKFKLSQQQSIVHERLKTLAALLKIPKIKRIECFDVSHTMGEQTVASCVVFNTNGPLRTEHRHYNINNITPGDDYAAISQVLYRRYNKSIEESKIPDIILIDGGKGHLNQAKKIFATLNVSWNKKHPLLLGIAKSSNRKVGMETIFIESEGKKLVLPSDSPALHIIQHIRDESHNHAINCHRKKRAKVKNTSILESIEGIGPKRRQMLLTYMGGLQGLLNANIEEIIKVPGISRRLAEKIYYSLKY